MLTGQFCRNFIEKALSGVIHKKRWEALIKQVESLLGNGKLTLTGLGRGLKGAAKVKHKIKITWRFLRNPKVRKDEIKIYKEFATPYLRGQEEVQILIDWSGCCNKKNYLLRASVAYDGRSIPIYNEVHPCEKQEDEEVQAKFLENLKQVLPEEMRVVILTDAGFKTPWFQKIQEMGWFFIGRVRGRISCRMEGESHWQEVKELHERIKRCQTCYLGEADLGKTSKSRMKVTLIGHFERYKGRKKTKKEAKYPDAEKAYAQSNSEPWILATNLKLEIFPEMERKAARTASVVKNMYKRRMQIEQNFRDDKNVRFGFRWRESRTYDTNKISVLCLIASISILILWLIGFSAEKQKLHYDFQVNTNRKHRVLSYPFLAKQVIQHALHLLEINSLFDAIDLLNSDYKKQLSWGV